MSRLLLLVPLIAACDETVDLPKKDEVVLAELGEPFAAIYANTAPDYLRSDCEMGVDLYEDGASTPAASAQVYAQGGEWTGMSIGTVLYTAEAYWQDCTTVASTGTGSFSSGAFSGVAGDFFLFRYDGVTGAFETLKQREQFEGGKALVTFRDNATSADVQELAVEIGVEADLLSTTAKEYEISWDDARAVGDVLTAFSGDNLYLDGEPVWIDAPEWW